MRIYCLIGLQIKRIRAALGVCNIKCRIILQFVLTENSGGSAGHIPLQATNKKADALLHRRGVPRTLTLWEEAMEKLLGLSLSRGWSLAAGLPLPL